MVKMAQLHKFKYLEGETLPEDLEDPEIWRPRGI